MCEFIRGRNNGTEGGKPVFPVVNDPIKPGFVLEGGSFHCDGDGTVITTEECLLNPNRNPNLSKTEIEDLLKSNLGVTTVIWLPFGLYNDTDTNGHVDNFCCFLGPSHVCIAQSDDPDDPQRSITDEAIEVLTEAVDAKGRRFRITILPTPSKPLVLTEEEAGALKTSKSFVLRTPGERLAGSYVNFYFANSAIILPAFDDPNDQVAADILTDACKDRVVRSVHTRNLLIGGGNIHCQTQQVPVPGTWRGRRNGRKRVLEVVVMSGIKGLREKVEEEVGGRMEGREDVAVRFKHITAPFTKEHTKVIQNAEVILADPGLAVEVIGCARGVKWMQSTWAGVNVMFDCSKRRDYKLTRIAGVFGKQMAEYVLSYVLQRERALKAAEELQSSRTWDPKPFKEGRRRTNGLTMGILGCGDIGRAVAGACKSFDMRTVGFKRSVVGVSVPGFDSLHDEVEGVLEEADFVVNTLPSTKDTRGIMGGDTLKVCKRGPMLINVGRGDVIDEEDVIRALDEGWISEAVLDVFRIEPLPESSPLWTHPKVKITPHVSAVSLPGDVAEVFTENLELYVDGKGLKYEVKWEKGY